MPRAVHATLAVPTGLSAHQAMAILDFLEDLHAAIWQAYEDPIAAVLMLDEESRPCAEAETPAKRRDPDDSPF